MALQREVYSHSNTFEYWALMLNGNYQFRFHCYKIPNTLFGILIIWNACYLECLVFGILSYSTSFTKFHWFHSLPIYYRFPSVLRTINHFSFHQRTFNSSTLDQQSECQYCGTSSATFDDPVFEQPKFGNPVVSLYPGHFLSQTGFCLRPQSRPFYIRFGCDLA